MSEAAGDLAHINMRRWPFTVVPSDESAEAWIGRAGEKRKVDRVLRSAERIAASQLVLVWAEYGAGKTHALRYLRNRAAASERIVPIYVATPRGIRSFVDLHRGSSTRRQRAARSSMPAGCASTSCLPRR